jgi:hypothetical protein
LVLVAQQVKELTAVMLVRLATILCSAQSLQRVVVVVVVKMQTRQVVGRVVAVAPLAQSLQVQQAQPIRVSLEVTPLSPLKRAVPVVVVLVRSG